MAMRTDRERDRGLARACRREQGIALVITMMAITLMLALGSALVLLSSSETAMAANFRAAHEAAYAADAILERALGDLHAVADWTSVVNGSARASFADGAPSGARTLADGSRVDLDQIANLANCGTLTACSDADMAATTAERPWGANNPRWRLYAYGPLSAVLGTAPVDSAFYVVASVADDPSENDGDPSIDGPSDAQSPNPGAGVVMLRAEAFGPRNAHRVVEATVKRLSTGLRVLSWRDVR